MEIFARNVNAALDLGLSHLLRYSYEEESRNGPVIVHDGIFSTTYTRPTERVLFSPVRDANPFFHLMESLWMLAGRNDIAFPAYFNKKFLGYSDDGIIQHAAYGKRWRSFFGHDQIDLIVAELAEKPKSRRAVLGMWSPYGDLIELSDGSGGLTGKDVPCNLVACFNIRNDVLNMTVFNRSNDIIWGAYGANAVHFSILQEYIASWLKVRVGTYTQTSNNMHAYTDIYDREKLAAMADTARQYDHYSLDAVHMHPYPLVHHDTEIEDWNVDLLRFMENPAATRSYTDPFFPEVAHPVYMAWAERKEKRGDGLGWAGAIKAPDWRKACVEWIGRRMERSRDNV